MQQAGGLENAAAGIQERVVDAFLHFKEYEKAIHALACMGDTTRAVTLAEQRDILIDQARARHSCQGIRSRVLSQELADRLCTGGVLSDGMLHFSVEWSVLFVLRFRQGSKGSRPDGGIGLRSARFMAVSRKEILRGGGESESRGGFDPLRRCRQSHRFRKCASVVPCVKSCTISPGRSRCSNVYITTANFLRTLDWSENADLCEKIIRFYTLADAKAPLARFYATRAQIEIDDYR